MTIKSYLIINALWTVGSFVIMLLVGLAVRRWTRRARTTGAPIMVCEHCFRCQRWLGGKGNGRCLATGFCKMCRIEVHAAPPDVYDQAVRESK